MKTILRIIVILLVAAVVAGTFSLAVNNNSTTSGSGDAAQPPAITSNSQSAIQAIGRPEGGNNDNGSFTGGFAGVVGTLAKLTAITILVLVHQKGFSQLGNRRPISTQQ